jgi:hypothetical protein
MEKDMNTTARMLLCSVLLALQACAPAPADLSAAADSSPVAMLAPALAQSLLEQQQAVTAAADLRDIKRLEHSYAQFLSAGRWQDAAALFSDTGVLVQGEQRYTPREIAALLQQSTGSLPGQGMPVGRLYEVMVLSPVLNLSATPGLASGRWRQLTLEGQYQQRANWAVGINENRYVKEAGAWKFAEFHHYPLFGGAWAEGWRLLKDEVPGAVQPVPFHYSVTEAGIPAPLQPLPAEIAALDVASAEQQLLALEQQAQRLLDEDAITNLHNSFGYYIDRKMWNDVADLFLPNGSFEYGQIGVFQGSERVRAVYEHFGGSGPLPVGEVFDHVQLQPVVSVAADGQSARARITRVQMMGIHEVFSNFATAVYLNDYRKQDGKWLLDKVRVYNHMGTDYQKGFAVDAQPAIPASADYPADAPPTIRYQSYPEYFSPEFLPVHERSNSTAAAAAAGTLEQRLAELARQTRQLDAYIGTENVANAYGYAIDEFRWDDMADLFAEQGWKELSYIGRYTGRERIRQSVVDRYGRDGRRANSMTFHQKTQPVITVSGDGNSSSIRTRLFQMNSSRQAGGSWMSGIYENTAVKENGVWKLSSMDLDYTWAADYLGGWALVEPGAFERFVPAPGSLSGAAAPDGPLRGSITPPYPTDLVDMAFHYDNPVSGRPAPLRLREREYLHGE